MALKTELQASGMSWELAKLLGWDAPVTVAAAGSGQTSATALTANHAIVGSGSGGVIIGDAQQQWFVQNSSGSSVTVYPPVSASFSGLNQNAGITVLNNKSLTMVPGGTTGITWDNSN